MPLQILLRWEKECPTNEVTGVKGWHRLGSRWILFISAPDDNCGGCWLGEEPSGDTNGDPEDMLSSEGSEDAETSPPCGTSLWLGMDDLLGLTALL